MKITLAPDSSLRRLRFRRRHRFRTWRDKLKHKKQAPPPDSEPSEIESIECPEYGDKPYAKAIDVSDVCGKMELDKVSLEHADEPPSASPPSYESLARGRPKEIRYRSQLNQYRAQSEKAHHKSASYDTARAHSCEAMGHGAESRYAMTLKTPEVIYDGPVIPLPPHIMGKVARECVYGQYYVRTLAHWFSAVGVVLGLTILVTVARAATQDPGCAHALT